MKCVAKQTINGLQQTRTGRFIRNWQFKRQLRRLIMKDGYQEGNTNQREGLISGYIQQDSVMEYGQVQSKHGGMSSSEDYLFD